MKFKKSYKRILLVSIIVLSILVQLFIQGDFRKKNLCSDDNSNLGFLNTNEIGGLVALYKFNGNINDSSPNGYDLTFTSFQDKFPPVFTEDRYGNPNKAVFISDDTRVKIENFLILNGNFTVSFWARIDYQYTSSLLFLGDTRDAFQWYFQYAPSFLSLKTPDQGNIQISSTLTYDWVQITFVCGESISIYKNGILQIQKNRTNNPFLNGQGNTLTIGHIKIDSSTTICADSYFDDIYFIDRALITEEVQQLFTDSDNDQLSDWIEINFYQTDIHNNDTDYDNIPDEWEANYGLSPTSALDNETDADSDGLINLLEYQESTNPNDPDSDDDDLNDGYEVLTLFIDPLNPDSDFDDLCDGEEVNTYFTDPAINDTDSDGLLDGLEVNVYFTLPKNNDTDSDNMPDGWEVKFGLSPLNGADNETDLDSDGLSNVFEYQSGTNPILIDTDSDGISDWTEIFIYNSNPSNNDTDHDNMGDGWEIFYGLNILDSADNETDNDLDDLINALEFKYTTNPNNSDTDSDDLLDGFEVHSTHTNPLAPDTDMDIMTDGWEYFNGLDPLSSGESYLDYDNDGLMNLIEFYVNSDPNKVDTDGDGYSDEDEVADFSDPSDPQDIPFGLGETTASIPFYLNEMYTDPYMHTRPATINYDFTTAFYKYDDNVDAFVIKRWAPYTGSAQFVSNPILFPNYFITSARVIIHAAIPFGTSIDIYITNNYFKTEHKIYNNTKVNFQVYGRQLAIKIVLKSTDPSVTPLFYGFTISSVGIKYNESRFFYNKTYHFLQSSKNQDKMDLKSMGFTYSSTWIAYGFEWRFKREEVNTTHDRIRCYIYVYAKTDYFVAWQQNRFDFDLNVTINGVDYRFFKVKGFETPYITSGKLGEMTLFNILIEHDLWEKIMVNASISYRCWNSEGGDVTGSASISTEFYQYCTDSIPSDDQIDLIIPGYNIIFIFGILVSFISFFRAKKKLYSKT